MDDGRITPVFGLEVVGDSCESFEGSIEAEPSMIVADTALFRGKGGRRGLTEYWATSPEGNTRGGSKPGYRLELPGN